MLPSNYMRRTKIRLILLSLLVMNTLVISGLLELITNLNSKREATQTRGTETEFTETIKEVVYEIADFLDNPKSTCRKLVDVGGFLDCRGCSATCDKNNRENESCNRCTEDGNKALCLDSEVAPNPGKCIVLSFGIGNDFSFDDQVARFGCQVYSFDFSMTNWTHKSYGPNRHFLSLGLSHSNIKGINFTYEHEGENRAISTSMLTLNSILDVLDIRDREISYLKMDIENAEWEVLQQVLKTSPSVLDRVLQLSLEVHLEDLLKFEREPEDTMPKIQRIRHVLKGLQTTGFQLTQSRKNLKTDINITIGERTFPLYREVLFLRSRETVKENFIHTR